MKNKVVNLFRQNRTIIPNNGVKYSELLGEFISPFERDFKNYEYLEDVFELAINAWNLANLNVLLPNEEFKKTMASIESGDFEISLLKKMIAHKEANYKVYTNFIINYEIKEAKAGEEPILIVMTLDEETYLADVLNAMEEEDYLFPHDDFEENFINRSAIILKPLEPFLDWCSKFYPDCNFEDELNETNVYLIDDTIDDVENWLKKKFDKIFMMELDSWCSNKKEWPQKRNYKMFNLWFQVRISDMIFDLEKAPILKSE